MNIFKIKYPLMSPSLSNFPSICINCHNIRTEKTSLRKILAFVYPNLNIKHLPKMSNQGTITQTKI
jgi:hypothetical protein